VRSRALLRLAVVGALAVASGIAAAAVDAGTGPLSESRAAATRVDVADAAVTGAITRARDPFQQERDGRRGDIAVLTAALLLAAGAGWWIIRSRDVRLITSWLRLRARPRGPPDLPAIVSI
jgi:hypothetical protein